MIVKVSYFFHSFLTLKKIPSLLLPLLLLLFAVSQTQLVPVVEASTLFVPSPTYPTIQSAIDAAKARDTIQVAAGIYYEHLVIDVRDLEIVGENKGTTILDANETGTPILIEAPKLTITGFTIRNGGSRNNGIKANLQSDHTITDNIIENNVDGIYLLESDNNIISGNTFVNNHMRAINLVVSQNNVVADNNISESAYGINLSSTNGTTITGNSISNTSYAIYVSGSSQNTISENRGHSSSCGIQAVYSDHLTIDNNIITGGMYGIQLHTTGDSQLANNTVREASYGIHLAYSNYNTIGGTRGNLVAESDWGIVIYNSTGNQIINGNILGENTWGLYITVDASGNTIHHNNFCSNIRQAVQNIGCINTWDDGAEGNYWDDYTGYPPAGGVDFHPLPDPWPMRNIATTNVTVSNTQAYAGEIVTINATVRNFGVITETIRLTTYFNFTSIAAKTATLAPDAAATLTYTWNTTNVEPGNYIISGTADPIPYVERNYTDNSLADDMVEIMILLGDINNDDIVNNDDLSLLAQAFSSTPSSSTWNPDADLNGDNKVDALDLCILCKNYGKTI